MITKDELQIYLRALKKQVHALKGSARWRIGDKSIRQVEKLLGRKDGLLAIDHIESMIDLLLKKNQLNIDYSQPSIEDDLLPVDFHLQPHIVFLVSHADWQTNAQGDMYTALELGLACEKLFGWTFELVSNETDAQKNPDIVISMLFNRRISSRPSTIYIAWVRSYAEQWVMKPWFDDFHINLCASHKMVRFISSISTKPTYLFPIATNVARFDDGQPSTAFNSDVCFSGNKWQEKRIIEEISDQPFDWKIKVFGAGWQDVTTVKKWHAGFLSYDDMPNAYASTKMVLDHANQSTLHWESVNSRVFDALGQGIPILTNNEAGVEQLFQTPIATYEDAESCGTKINDMLSSAADAKWVESIKEEIRSNHTYDVRSALLNKILANAFNDQHHINVLISASDATVAHQWGDYHFAKSLCGSLEKGGHSTAVLVKNEWDVARKKDSINIVLRGIHPFIPADETVNILWIISHPASITADELNAYDHIFVASEIFLEEVKKMTNVPCDVLWQCTDAHIFYPKEIEELPAFEHLYVANSRGKMRLAPALAKEGSEQFAVFGSGWEKLLPADWIKGEHIPNQLLACYYHSAGVVINDHWPDMANKGFLSNRIFDVLACEGNIITEEASAWPDGFPVEAVTQYNNDNFIEKLGTRIDLAVRQDAAQYIRANHTFDHRAASMLSCIWKLKSSRKGI